MLRLFSKLLGREDPVVKEETAEVPLFAEDEELKALKKQHCEASAKYDDSIDMVSTKTVEMEAVRPFTNPRGRALSDDDDTEDSGAFPALVEA